MYVGRVLGSASATVKHPSMEGWKLLLVMALQADGMLVIGGTFQHADTAVARNRLARLNADGRPDWRDESGGRYIACRTGFYDPTVFRVNRDLTITGTLASYEVRRISGHDYRFPLIEANVIHLWPERIPPKRKSWPYWYW